MTTSTTSFLTYYGMFQNIIASRTVYSSKRLKLQSCVQLSAVITVWSPHYNKTAVNIKWTWVSRSVSRSSAPNTSSSSSWTDASSSPSVAHSAACFFCLLRSSATRAAGSDSSLKRRFAFCLCFLTKDTVESIMSSRHSVVLQDTRTVFSSSASHVNDTSARDLHALDTCADGWEYSFGAHYRHLLVISVQTLLNIALGNVCTGLRWQEDE